MSDLTSLLERVKAAYDGLDGDLAQDLSEHFDYWHDPEIGMWRGPGRFLSDTMPPFGESLDFTLALVERVDPDALVKLSNERMGWWIATVRLSTGAVCKTAALALLAALLSALADREHHAAQAARAAQVAGEGSRDEPSLPNPLIRGE